MSAVRAFLYGVRTMLLAVLTVCVSLSLSTPFEAWMQDEPSVKASADTLPVIILDAGHGGEDSGAVGVGGVLEKELNLKIALMLSDMLRAAGYRVILTRTEDKLLYTEAQNIKGQRKIYDLKNRLLVSEQQPEAIFISIHMNTFPEASCKGLQVWYSPRHDHARQLAEAVQGSVSRHLQKDNTRKVKKAGSHLYLLYHNPHPALLIECGFLSNAADSANLSEESYQKELSFVIFYAMMEWITQTYA
ncbi:MAG: N-acetylmuramoyl-L-alanine amidase [Eubacteriales bacterium]